MKGKVTVIGCGDSRKAREIAEALSRKSETTGSVIVLEEQLDDFMEQCVDGFQLPGLDDDCVFEVEKFKPQPKYTCFGKLKKR